MPGGSVNRKPAQKRDKNRVLTKDAAGIIGRKQL